MPRADVVCLVVPVALVSLALLLSLRRGAWESEAAVIRRLRRRLSGAHELRRVQRRVYEATSAVPRRSHFLDRSVVNEL